jgi:hypothetical protein
MTVASLVCCRPVAEAKGELTLTGNRQRFDRFLTWFPLPEKIG